MRFPTAILPDQRNTHSLSILLQDKKTTVKGILHVIVSGRKDIIRENSGPAHADGDWFEAGKLLEIRILEHSLKVLVP